MRSRVVWFVAGSVAGVYTATKARRAAYRLSAPGVVDQAAALGVGWRAFSDEMREGMQAREDDIVRSLSETHTPIEQTPIDPTPPDVRNT